jgi:hypothetical protein
MASTAAGDASASENGEHDSPQVAAGGSEDGGDLHDTVEEQNGANDDDLDGDDLFGDGGDDETAEQPA